MARIFLSAFLFLAAAAGAAWAQDVTTVEQQIEKLRAQLREVADREAQLRERAHQLDEDLRPENVERSVLGIGTTDARALREQRRQQLERQKEAVEGQLSDLAVSRARLEAAISGAEAEAVRLRAAALGANTAGSRAAPTATPAAATDKGKARVRRSKPPKRAKPKRRL